LITGFRGSTPFGKFLSAATIINQISTPGLIVNIDFFIGMKSKAKFRIVQLLVNG